MELQCDDYLDVDSWVHRWDARFKLVALVGLMMTFAAIRSLWLLPWMLILVGLLYRLSHLPISFLRRRLRYPGLFLVGIVLFIPWVTGETPIWHWGPLTLWQEGCLAAILITGRFLCSVTLGFIVLGTTSFLTLVQAMRALGIPALLTDMMLLSYRYVFEIWANLNRMRRAMTLRGFSSTKHRSTQTQYPSQIIILATLAGTLFIRSYEQAERVYQAMRLRGYGLHSHRMPHRIYASRRQSGSCLGDAIALMSTVVIALSLLIANYWLSHASAGA